MEGGTGLQLSRVGPARFTVHLQVSFSCFAFTICFQELLYKLTSCICTLVLNIAFEEAPITITGFIVSAATLGQKGPEYLSTQVALYGRRERNSESG